MLVELHCLRARGFSKAVHNLNPEQNSPNLDVSYDLDVMRHAYSVA